MQSLFLSRLPTFSAFSFPFRSGTFFPLRQNFMGYASSSGGRRGWNRARSRQRALNMATERAIQVPNPTPQQAQSIRMASRMARQSLSNSTSQSGGGGSRRLDLKPTARKRKKRSKTSISSDRFRSLLEKITKPKPQKQRRK